MHTFAMKGVKELTKSKLGAADAADELACQGVRLSQAISPVASSKELDSEDEGRISRFGLFFRTL